MLHFVMSREELEDCIGVIVHILISDENLILAEKGDPVKEREKEQMIHILPLRLHRPYCLHAT